MFMSEVTKNVGSGINVTDYSMFCEGNVEPSTNKKIKELIISDSSYIVFLDEEDGIEWASNDDYE